MIKYVNPNSIQEDGKCLSVGEGTNTERYKAFGMIERDVEKSEIDNQWYLKDLCPHYTEEEIAEQEELKKEQAIQKENELALADLKERMATADLQGDEEWKAELREEYAKLMGEE